MLFAAAIALGLAGGGCAAQTGELDKQIAAMRSDLIGLRAENAALAERVDALEIANGHLKGYEAPAATAAPAAPDKPDLAVVRLAPDEPKHDGADDGGPRVVLRSTGKGGVVEEDVKDDGASGPTADFAKAKELFDKKNYSDALAALSAFLLRYPNDTKAADATYLRGECYVAKSDWSHAVTDLEAALGTSPASDRAPDALFDLAKSYDKLGKKDAAEKAKKKLKSDFPKSNAAKRLN